MNSVKKVFGDRMRDLAQGKAAMGEMVGARGGYLVPQEMLMLFDKGFNEVSIFGMNAWVHQMQSPILPLPNVDITVSHAVGVSPLFGGVLLTWTQEGATGVQSVPAFSSTILRAKSLIALINASNQLVMDGGEPLADYLMTVGPGAAAWQVDYDCFNGSGVGKPLGIINAGSSVQVTRQNAGHISQQDLANMVGQLIPGCFARAIWACSPNALTDICNFSTYMTNRNPDSAGILCGTLFSRPLFVTEKLPVKGTAGALVLFDPKCYALGVREIAFDRCDHVPGAFESNQAVFRVIWRGDGLSLANGTATLADGTTTAGVSVILI